VRVAATRPAPAPRRHGTAAADRTRRQPRGAARKEAILAAAVGVLARKGFRGVRLTDVAEAAGVTHPNLAYYFGTKERLLREAVQERERRDAGFYGVPAELRSLQNLGKTAQYIVEHALDTRLYVVLAAESLDADDALHGFFVERYAAARAYVALAVRNDQARGLLSLELDPDQAAFEILSMMMGLEIQWLMDPDGVDYTGIVERFTTSFFVRHAVGAKT